MSLALYRKYRPGQFSELIGQEHVTEPLTRALESDRVHHAYLFTGPRGCGKTSSARILARSLNCVEGPTPNPCGECDSCIGLAPNGPGSIDVIEMDAATHGLVDDARDLREKAIYAPAGSRYKIYIIDEAHQLGPGAANALLKLIEEPPPHLRFVFATTEPDKIIGTIRSRTHQYAFRLVPSRTLQAHLEQVCESEGVSADPAALALVARAAGGSVRDALSILGQLVAGSGDDGITYAETVRQLGVTDAALLDEVITALSASDGAALLQLVDQVVNAGHDPRRFATDLLERLRDLLVLRTVPDAAAAGLLDAPDDVVAGWAEQAEQLSTVELSRLADLVSDGLTELKGATAPRLQLELLAARLITPQVEAGDPALLVRIDQLERALAAVQQGSAASAASTRAAQVAAGAPASGPAISGPGKAEAGQSTPSDVAANGGNAPRGRGSTKSGATGAATGRRVPRKLSDVAPSTGDGGSGPSADAVAAVRDDDPVSATDAPADAGTGQAQPSAKSARAASDAAGKGPSLDQLRALWPAVLDNVREQSRVAWMIVHNTTPIGISDGVVTAAHADAGAIKSFQRAGHDERVRQAMLAVVRADLTLELVHDPDRAKAGAGAPAQSEAKVPPAAGDGADAAGANGGGADGDGADNRGLTSAAETSAAAGSKNRSAGQGKQSSGESDPPEPGVLAEKPPTNRGRSTKKASAAAEPAVPPEADVASEDDETLDDAVSGIALIQAELGGTVVSDGEGA